MRFLFFGVQLSKYSKGLNNMDILARKLWFTLTKPARVAVLDYEVNPAPLYTNEKGPHERLFKIISQSNEDYIQLVKKSIRFKPAFEKIQRDSKNEKLPAWENGFFPSVDTIMLYTLLENFRPKMYVEIGSGNSTKVAAFCRKQEKIRYSITSIDPHPRREIREIADLWFEKPIQQVELDLFNSLEPNDILFMDGSHVLHANSDVMWFFLEILPAIPKGVIIHIHDIFLPYDYPLWFCQRFFSEQYILASCLLNSEYYKIICPNYYVLNENICPGVWEELWKIPTLNSVEKTGRSFWFTKV
jgi:hypothetical protein